MLQGLIGLEPRHLGALAAVAEERSFKGAASRRGYVQSAVRQQIAQLERIVGTPLIDRSRGPSPVELTPAGAELVPHAAAIVARLDAAAADLRALARPRVALRVGVADRGTTRLLLAALGHLRQTVPDLHVEICDEGDDRGQHDAVLRGSVDVALGDLPSATSTFASRAVADDPVVLVTAATSPLARRRRPLTLDELAAIPLVLDRGWGTVQLLEARMNAAGLAPHVVVDTGMTAGAQALAVAGIGSALLPRLAVDEADPRVVVVDLGHLIALRQVVLYWHGDRMLVPGLEALAAAVVSAAATLTAPRLARPVTTAPLTPPPVVATAA